MLQHPSSIVIPVISLLLFCSLETGAAAFHRFHLNHVDVLAFASSSFNNDSNNNGSASDKKIFPGTGLVSTDGGSSKSPKKYTEVVVFEHTELGTGGLVLNQPTPVLLKHLKIPIFSDTFGSNALYLGCGMKEEEEKKGGETITDKNESNDIFSSSSSSSSNSNVAMGDMAPWFWLHDLDNLKGSFQLEGAASSLYMGGNLEEAIERFQTLAAARNNDNDFSPFSSDECDDSLLLNQHFKFFWKYKSWGPGELEEQIRQGMWTVEPQDPCRALRP